MSISQRIVVCEPHTRYLALCNADPACGMQLSRFRPAGIFNCAVSLPSFQSYSKPIRCQLVMSSKKSKPQTKLQDTSHSINRCVSQKNLMASKSLKENIRLSTLEGAQGNRFIDPEHPLKKMKNAAKKLLKRFYVQCKICEDSYKIKQTSKFQSCQHRFCKSCIDKYLTYRINTRSKVKCPEDECSAMLTREDQLFLNLPMQLQTKFLKTEKFLLTVQNPDIKPCTQSNCQGFVDISKTPCVCTVCKLACCPHCLYLAHQGQCQDFHVEFLHSQYGMQRCKRCRNLVLKSQGCNHMKCRCGNQFCYRCGENWKGAHQCSQRIDPLPPPIPQDQRGCCYYFLNCILKSIEILICATLWIPISAGIVGLSVLAFLLVSIFAGGIRLLQKCPPSFWLRVLLFPLVLVAGIFWDFFINLRQRSEVMFSIVIWPFRMCLSC